MDINTKILIISLLTSFPVSFVLLNIFVYFALRKDKKKRDLILEGLVWIWMRLVVTIGLLGFLVIAFFDLINR
ncbi:hypothetical protein NNL84_06940 [Enterococcus faecium]|nr:hypothetical protein [Enterococcus faecium]